MARELLTQIVQDPSRGFTRRPDLTVRHPDLVFALDAHADDHIRARMYGPAAPPSATEHALRLNVKPAAVTAAAAHLRALWKRELVDFQPVDGRGIPVGGRPYFPYATCPDLTAEPREELRGILDELARQGSHLLYGELLGDGGQGTRRFGEILTDALSREEPLRIRVDSDLVLPWPMLALPEDTASGPGGPVGDAFRRFLGYRHQIEQTGGHHPSLPAPPALPDPADDEHARLPPPLPVVSLNHDQGIDPEGATRAGEVESALATGTVRVERTRCDELLGALRSGALEEQLMYFWCHGHFRPVPDDSAPLFAVRLSDHKDIDVRTVLTERGVAEPPLPRRPLVFLNACYAGLPADAEPARLGGALIEAGAGGVLGPQIEMPRLFAAEYAHAYITRYLGGRETAGEIVHGLARHFADVWSNPLGLAYALQCGMDSRLERATLGPP
ncbi:CHAT domain-containing protein [Streptomyces sp. NBC_00268]|uniref:CHAT domain-containing protein n=1 Tax=Streptomyces sp. NBC_00268 TaxID=2975695 RepID=UPI002252BCA6|nr:CHAT domain-containing protein [Streptomyces sp. NBC_00268]MCX5186910.1 CHAT domain-containing protein [Streptomyces sp. NBC_00268]